MKKSLTWWGSAPLDDFYHGIPALFLARLSSIVFTLLLLLLLLLPLLWPLFAAGAQPRWPLRAGPPSLSPSLPLSVE